MRLYILISLIFSPRKLKKITFTKCGEYYSENKTRFMKNDDNAEKTGIHVCIKPFSPTVSYFLARKHFRFGFEFLFFLISGSQSFMFHLEIRIRISDMPKASLNGIFPHI